jgi:hypothetical protein
LKRIKENSMRVEDLQKPEVAKYLESIQREEMMFAIKEVCQEVVSDAAQNDAEFQRWVSERSLESLVKTLADKLVGEMTICLS